MITLAELEREVARRVGPFYWLPMDRQIPSTANLERAFFPALRSTVEQDLVKDMWLLRRGVLADGTLVPVLDFDRQRTVANYEPSSGAVEVDRPWSVQPAASELCEFHHLDPTQELRQSVLAGLRRARFADRYAIPSGYYYELDLTQALPYLHNPRDVLGIETNQAFGYACDVPFEVFQQGGHVCIRLTTIGTFWPGLLLSVARDACHYVNGADSTSGPTADDDQLEIDLDYAAAAGHIEAWHHFPAKTQAAAAGGLQATREQAAAEFGRIAAIYAPRGRDRYGFSRMPVSHASSLVINTGPVYAP